jgi:hypothetical protein
LKTWWVGLDAPTPMREGSWRERHCPRRLGMAGVPGLMRPFRSAAKVIGANPVGPAPGARPADISET